MHVRRRHAVALTLALLTVAATGSGTSAEAQDPCGDILYAGDASLAPADWSSFDLQHVRIAETGDRAAGTHAVVVTMELCGPAVDPQEAQDVERWYRLEWPVEDGCRQGFAVAWEGTTIDIAGEIDLTYPNRQRLYEVCTETRIGDHAAVGDFTRHETLPAGSVAIDGSTLTVTLRGSELDVMGDLFAPGTVLTAPVASTRAAAPMLTGRFCTPDGACTQLGGEDMLQLPDAVLRG